MKVAVIGIGRLGQRHLEKWGQIAGVEVVGIMARSEEKLRDMSWKYGVEPFQTIADIVAETDVDVIDICTPTHTHYEFVKQAALAGKHIICEKPLTLTAAKARELVDLCAQQAVLLFVGHTLQFFPAYVYAREMAVSGKLGVLEKVRLARGVPFPANTRDWYVDEKKSGGLLLDLGIHEFEWLRSVCGVVSEVTVSDVKYKGSAVVYGIVMIKFATGLMVDVELSWDEPAFRSSLEVVGERAKVVYRHTDEGPILSDALQGKTTEIKEQDITKEDPYVWQLRHFIACIKQEEAPILATEHAVDAIEIAEAARRSIREKRTIKLKKTSSGKDA